MDYAINVESNRSYNDFIKYSPCVIKLISVSVEWLPFFQLLVLIASEDFQVSVESKATYGVTYKQNIFQVLFEFRPTR